MSKRQRRKRERPLLTQQEVELRLPVRQDFMRICGQDRCMAILLSYFTDPRFNKEHLTTMYPQKAIVAAAEKLCAKQYLRMNIEHQNISYSVNLDIIQRALDN